MFELSQQSKTTTDELLMSKGFSPALALNYLKQGKLSKTVELCREYLKENDSHNAVRMIYANALLLAGQKESATEQLQLILRADPDHLTALKLLGETKFESGDEIGSVNCFERIMQIDPYYKNINSSYPQKKIETTTTTITFKHPKEETTTTQSASDLRAIPFYTETIGDLYLSQGHLRLAEKVFTNLKDKEKSNRLDEKLVLVQKRIKEKHHVKKTN